MYKTFFKPFLDRVIAFIGLVILFPIFLVVAVMLIFSNSGTPFFTQNRPGKGKRIFTVIKFKTMNNKKDDAGILLPDEQRLTSLGKWVRKSSVDEIPQLINVIKGDMSLIGPRPLLEEYLPLYSQEQARRHNVRPGITGWAQVNGRNTVSWNEKFRYDMWYVDNLSFWLDLKIIFMTLNKVIRMEGISSDTSTTMEKFTGN